MWKKHYLQNLFDFTAAAVKWREDVVKSPSVLQHSLVFIFIFLSIIRVLPVPVIGHVHSPADYIAAIWRIIFLCEVFVRAAL